MKFLIYIGFLMMQFQLMAFSKDADFFTKEFDHIYLLEPVKDGDGKYAYKIIKKFKFIEDKKEIAADRVKKHNIHARPNRRALFSYKIHPEIIWLYELDDSGDFTFEMQGENQKAGKKYKLNIKDLESVQRDE